MPVGNKHESIMTPFFTRERILEIVRFGCVGVTAVLIHYGVYYLLLPLMDKNIAYTVGYLVSFLCNFLMSSFITFRVRPSFRRFFRFLSSHGVNYLLSIGLFNFFCWVGVPVAYAPLPVYLIAVPVNFLLVRYALVKKGKPHP